MAALNLVLAGLALQAATPALKERAPVCFAPILIMFDSGSAVLRPSAIVQLDDFLRVYADRAGPSRLRLTGSADRVGPAEANLRLSRRRAEAVARYLTRKAVGRAYLELAGDGETRLFVDTPDGTAEQSNRVVLIEEFADPAEGERYDAYWRARPGQAPVC